MGRLYIKCAQCGSGWEIYHRDNWKDWRASMCPNCGRNIPSDLWKQVLRGFNEMEDANIELQKEESQRWERSFRVGYIPDSPRQENLTEKLEEVKEEIEGVKEELRDFKNMFLGGEDPC